MQIYYTGDNEICLERDVYWYSGKYFKSNDQ